MRVLAIISALALLATPALGQTDGVLKAGDALRQCLQGSDRPFNSLEQFLGSIATADGFGWIATEIAPGKHRLDHKDAGFGVTIEILIVDTLGIAHCIAYGPALKPGDAVTAVDRAIVQGLMPHGVTRRVEPPLQGADRYYLRQEGRTRYGLTAYRDARLGEVVGFVITGLPTAATQSHGMPRQTVAFANLTHAAGLCFRPGISTPQRAQLFRQAGYSERVDRSTNNANTIHYFTDPSNRVTAQVYYGETGPDCFASSDGVGVTDASAILDGLIPRFYPSYTRQVAQGPGGAICVTYQEPRTPVPHVIGVAAQGGAQDCVENGSARIYGFYAV